MEIFAAGIIAIICLWLFVHSKTKSRVKPDEEDSGGPYRVLQFPSISSEQIDFACRNSIDLLHNSIVHGRDLSSRLQWEVSRGSHFSELEVEHFESYLVGAFATFIDKVMATQEVRLHDQKIRAFVELARQLCNDKPSLYLMNTSINRPITFEALGDRLMNHPKERSSFALGQENANQLIEHLNGVGPIPDTSTLSALLRARP